jgi:Domain of unknown function (DUF5655)
MTARRSVDRWTCPRCDREFARQQQSHACLPGGSVDESFAGRPPGQRAAYEAVVGHLRTLGPVHEDAVQVGVFLKRTRKLAEVRPKSKWVALTIYLDRRIDDPRIARTLQSSSTRTVHEVKLRDAGDVDVQVLAWLTEAYEGAG